MPPTGAALSAAGALMADLSSEFRRMFFATSSAFDAKRINALLGELETLCEEFAATYGRDAVKHEIEFAVEARYQSQVWEIELPISTRRFSSAADLDALKASFHSLHERIYAVSDERSAIEFVTWIARVRCRVAGAERRLVSKPAKVSRAGSRRTYFSETGVADTPVHDMERLIVDENGRGPAIVETPFTTIVIPPGAEYVRTKQDNLVIHPTGRKS
jgi:N-methylhydantoinase A